MIYRRDGWRSTYLLYVEGQLDLGHVLAEVTLQRCNVDGVSHRSRHFRRPFFFLFLCLDWTTTTMRGRELEDSDDPIDYIDTGQDRQRTHKEKEKKPEGRERIIPVIATTGFLEKNRGRRTNSVMAMC